VAWAVEKLGGGRRTSLTADVSLRLQKAVARARAEQVRPHRTYGNGDICSNAW
jgi:hypothetical protein